MTSKLPLLLAAALTLSGCVSLELGRLARDVTAEVERDGRAEVGPGFAVSVGGGMIGTSRFLSRLVAPESTEPYRRLSGEVRQVKVARYPLTGRVDGLRMARPGRLDAYEADGWLPLVSARDSASAVWVLYRETPDALRLTDLLAVVVSDEELMLARVRGDLTAAAVEAVRIATESDVLGDALDETGLFGPRPPEPGGAPAVDAGP